MSGAADIGDVDLVIDEDAETLSVGDLVEDLVDAVLDVDPDTLSVTSSADSCCDIQYQVFVDTVGGEGRLFDCKDRPEVSGFPAEFKIPSPSLLINFHLV